MAAGGLDPGAVDAVGSEGISKVEGTGFAHDAEQAEATESGVWGSGPARGCVSGFYHCIDCIRNLKT